MAFYVRKRAALDLPVSSGGRYTAASLMAGGAGRPDRGDPWAGMSTGMTISAYLLSALLVWGGIGYVLDRVANTGKVLTAIGMVVGAAAGIYLIYLRYGREDDHGDG